MRGSVPSLLAVSAGANTWRWSGMSEDDQNQPKKTVSWIAVASLLVAVARLLLDLWRKG
jgi:hypothetical protein